MPNYGQLTKAPEVKSLQVRKRLRTDTEGQPKRKRLKEGSYPSSPTMDTLEHIMVVGLYTQFEDDGKGNKLQRFRAWLECDIEVDDDVIEWMSQETDKRQPDRRLGDSWKLLKTALEPHRTSAVFLANLYINRAAFWGISKFPLLRFYDSHEAVRRAIEALKEKKENGNDETFNDVLDRVICVRAYGVPNAAMKDVMKDGSYRDAFEKPVLKRKPMLPQTLDQWLTERRSKVSQSDAVHPTAPSLT